MKKLALLLIVVASIAWGQDINIPRPTQNFIVAARAARPNASGGQGDCSIDSCGFNSNWILQTLYPQEQITITVFNNSNANTQSITLKAAIANDPSVLNYTGNTARWSNPVTINTTPISLGPQLGTQFVFQSSGAAKVVLIFTGTTITDPAGLDIVISQSQTSTSNQVQTVGIIAPSTAGLPVLLQSINGLNPPGVSLGCQNVNGGLCVENGLDQIVAGNNYVGNPSFPANGVIMTEPGPRWHITNAPASGTAATATFTSPSLQTVVVDCISFSASSSAAVTATTVTVSIVDSTAATTLWQLTEAIPTAGAAGVQLIPAFSQCGLRLPVTTLQHNITCQFSAGVTGVNEAINCTGLSTL